MGANLFLAPSEKPVTGIVFRYDAYSGSPQLEMNAYVHDISADGAMLDLDKRVGPMNYAGHKKEEVLSLSGEQVGHLLEILGRYDLAAWTALPTASSGCSPSRSLCVQSGNELIYDIMWSAKFPETLPPLEDVMYFEIFNFFNGIVAKTPGWEEVRSEDLPDPRQNPVYSDRTIMWFGKPRKLVPGTGKGHENGEYAEIDYEGASWWLEEGFQGHWVADANRPAVLMMGQPMSMTGFSLEQYISNANRAAAQASSPVSDTELYVYPDGTVLFKLNGEIWIGGLQEKRIVGNSVRMGIHTDTKARYCTVECTEKESYRTLHVTCFPGPVPSEQFIPIDEYLKFAE